MYLLRFGSMFGLNLFKYLVCALFSSRKKWRDSCVASRLCLLFQPEFQNLALYIFRVSAYDPYMLATCFSLIHQDFASCCVLTAASSEVKVRHFNAAHACNFNASAGLTGLDWLFPVFHQIIRQSCIITLVPQEIVSSIEYKEIDFFEATQRNPKVRSLVTVRVARIAIVAHKLPVLIQLTKQWVLHI